MADRMETLEAKVTAMDGSLTNIRHSLLQLTQDLAKMMKQPPHSEVAVVNGEKSGVSHLEEFHLAARKVELPLFDGTDPVGWITRAETYFEVQSTPEDVKVKLVKLSMDGSTIHWYNLLRETEDDLTWLKLRRALIDHYGGRKYDNSFEELSVLKQVGNMEDYIADFEYISSQVTRLPEEQYMGYFMGGLREEIRCKVRTLGPKNRSQAMKVARNVEAELACLSGERKEGELRVWSGSGSRNFRGPHGDSNWAKKGTANTNSPNTGQPQAKETQPQQAQLTKCSDRTTRGQKHLPNSVINDRRSKGLCFKCSERWHPLHQCAEKHLRIIIVGDDEIVGDDSEVRGAETEENGTHSQP